MSLDSSLNELMALLHSLGWWLLSSSVKTELLLDSGLLLSVDLNNVKSDGLGEGSALSNSDNVTFLDTGEGW